MLVHSAYTAYQPEATVCQKLLHTRVVRSSRHFSLGLVTSYDCSNICVCLPWRPLIHCTLIIDSIRYIGIHLVFALRYGCNFVATQFLVTLVTLVSACSGRNYNFPCINVVFLRVFARVSAYSGEKPNKP